MVRAVRLLKQLATRQGSVDLAQLTAVSGLARTTAYRLLSALESEGLVRRDATGRYQVGPVLIALGERARSASDLASTARGVLEQLARTTGETATLEILDDRRMLIIDEVAGQHLTGAGLSIGTSWALHATSSGKALLAALPARERVQLLRGRLRRFTASTITNRDELDHELAVIIERGFAHADGELEDGFAAVSAVVYDALGEPIAALSVNAPSIRLRGSAVMSAGRRVRVASRRVSVALGSGVA